jgi:hypothetical protein
VVSPTKAAFAFETCAVKLPLCLALIALSLSEIAYAAPTSAGVPLPRPRPAVADEAVSVVDKILSDPDFLRIPDPDPPGIASPCQIRMSEGGTAIFQSLPAIFRAPRGCGAGDVVRLETIVLSDNTRVAMSPPATMRCAMAEAVTQWVRDELAPTFAKAGGLAGPTVRALDNYASYDCRGRNNNPNARTSEHGFANALDVRGVRLTDGKFVQFTDRAVAKDLREGLKKQACSRFTTVLGPGSDGHHEEHIHFDLVERRGGFRMCQWDVLDPVQAVPLPRPRPADAPPAVALPSRPSE